MAEVVYERSLERLGLNEVETDFTSLLLLERPTPADLEALVPYGWTLIESRVIIVDEWQPDDEVPSDEDDRFDPDVWWPDSYDTSSDDFEEVLEYGHS